MTERAAPSRRGRRNHPAAVARIVAAGAAATATFGLVAVLGHGRQSQLASLPTSPSASSAARTALDSGATAALPALDGATTTPAAPVTVAPSTPLRHSAPVARSTAS